MSKMDFMKIMGEIDDEVLERFYAVEPKIGIMAVRRRVIRAVSALVACLIVIASLAVAPALISGADEEEPDEVTTTTTKETTKRTTTINEEPKEPDNNVTADPAPLWDYLNQPYAIVKILEVTDEKQSLCQSQQTFSSPYVKITCEVLYAYRPESVLGTTLSYEPESFNSVNEIYVIESSVEEIAQYDMILIDIVLMKMNYKYYYGPYTNHEEKAEYLPFVDGKLVIGDNLYDTFGHLFDEVNYCIDKYANRESVPVPFGELPKEKFANGMTYDQVVAFFDACNNVLEMYYEIPKLADDPNVDI